MLVVKNIIQQFFKFHQFFVFHKKANSPLDKSLSCVIIQRLFDGTIEFGGIAQLGERLNGIQEVSGSIPLISTTES